MQTRFRLSLEPLGDRLTPSTWNPTTLQTRQVSTVQDLAPPEPDLNVPARQTEIPSVTDLVMDPFNGRVAVLEGSVTGRITGVAVDPSADVMPNDWVFGTELPTDEARQIRHRMFAIVDRTQLTVWPEELRRNLITTLSADIGRPVREADQPPSSEADGRKYKMLFAPLILEVDTEGGEPGVSVVLQRLANPSLPDATAGDAYYGTGVYKSVDSGRTW